MRHRVPSHLMCNYILCAI